MVYIAAADYQHVLISCVQVSLKTWLHHAYAFSSLWFMKLFCAMLCAIVNICDLLGGFDSGEKNMKESDLESTNKAKQLPPLKF